MDYKKYQNSRDAAWQILIDHNVRELPVRVSRLCKDMGIDVCLYTPKDKGNDGMCILDNKQPIILVNTQCSLQRQRFTTAHELGHIILGHLGKCELVNREPSPTDNSIEHEANVFASRLLAPAIVLRDLNVQSASDIARICDISMQSAEFRWERLKLLYEREREFLWKRGCSCFGLAPLEREIQKRFGAYITQNQL